MKTRAGVVIGTAMLLGLIHSAEAGTSLPTGPAECHEMLGRAKAELVRYWDRSTPSWPEQEEYDVLHYGLNFCIDPVAQEVGGLAGITIRSMVAALDTVVLDFMWRASQEITVDSVHVGGVAAAFSWSDDHSLRVAAVPALGHAEEVLLEIWYQGNPQTQGVGFKFGVTARGDTLVWTLSEPEMARSWWPCKDVPADKATAEVTVRVPENMTAVSNGTLLDVTSHGDGTHTWRWSEGYPIATYLVSLAICTYDQFEDTYVTTGGDSMSVVFYVFPEHRTRADEDFRYTVDMIAFFASIFGEYPFLAEKYGMVEFPWGGGMEHQTITSYGSALITGDHRYDSIVAHELAHQWWGDSVTLETWDDIWLNEGFAVYSEALWQFHIGGEGAYREFMDDIDRVQGFAGTLYAPSADPDSAFSYPYVYTVYDKGAWVLHMLRHVVGDSVFFEVLRAYAGHPDHAYGTANTAQFQALVETHYGSSLGWFFDEWVYGTGRPEYVYWWERRVEGGEHALVLNIEQVQTSAGIFEMPLDVIVTTATGETTLVVVSSQQEEEFEFWLEERPVRVQLDPDGWVLKSIVERPTVLALHAGYPNPFHQTTTISFDLPENERVDLAIYDVTGRLVRRLLQADLPSTHYEEPWDGRDDRHIEVAPGVYFCRLAVGGRAQVRPVVLIR